MENQTQAVATQQQLTEKHLQKLSNECKQLVLQNEHWQQLVQAGTFEEDKALAAIACNGPAIDALHPVSISEARNCGLPALSTLLKYRGKDKQQMLLQYVLTEINIAYGEKRSMSPAALMMLGRHIYAEHWHLNLAEIKHAISMGIAGKYMEQGENLPEALVQETKVYGSPEVPTLLKWFECYAILKKQWAAQAQQDEHALRQRNEEHYTDEGRKLMLDVLQKVARKHTAQMESEAQAAGMLEEPGDYKAKLKYRTIEEYCLDNDIDAKQYLEQLRESWKAGYQIEIKSLDASIQKDVPLELYMQQQYQRALLHLNDKQTVI